MALYTKSIALPVEKSDGKRICIMRKPDAGAKYDLWISELSPSPELREKTKQGIGWEKFKIEFEKELQGKEAQKALKKLIEMSENHDITIMCIEPDPNFCHRSLVAQVCQKLNPKLKVIIK